VRSRFGLRVCGHACRRAWGASPVLRALPHELNPRGGTTTSMRSARDFPMAMTKDELFRQPRRAAVSPANQD